MIRLKSLELFCFKNVEHGKIDFSELPSGGSITGIYGQNGSGKPLLLTRSTVLGDLLQGILKIVSVLTIWLISLTI